MRTSQTKIGLATCVGDIIGDLAQINIRLVVVQTIDFDQPYLYQKRDMIVNTNKPYNALKVLLYLSTVSYQMSGVTPR